jgi:hypothetical protein
MAVAEQRQLPPQYVEDLQKDYGKQLTATTAAPLDTSKFAPQVAAQDAAQTSAYNLATGQGIGAFSPYITQAGAYDTAGCNCRLFRTTSLPTISIPLPTRYN